MGGLGAAEKYARVPDPIEIPLRSNQAQLLVMMIGARAAISRASLDAESQATRAWDKKLPRASICFDNLTRRRVSVLRPG